MAFDGTLKFDTSIDKSGFESGLSKIGSIAKTGMDAVKDAVGSANSAVSDLGHQAVDLGTDFASISAMMKQAMDAVSNDVLSGSDACEGLAQAALEASQAVNETADAFGDLFDASNSAAKVSDSLSDAFDRIDKDGQELSDGLSDLSSELQGSDANLKDTQEQSDKTASSLDDLGDSTRKTEKDFSSFKETLGNIAKQGFAVVAGAIGIATGAMAALGTKALEAYADYEQLTGGVATLFGAQDMSLEEYAQSVGKTVDAVKGEYDSLIAAQEAVMGNAAEAFRTAGLSQNEYMETVTSFSAALIASLDGDTAKAAQVADRAIVDMADNANKMGSSMESIQNAYQGFAKQNYTMLDNLKLGYGGTKSEMERLLADAQKISGIEFNIESYADVVEAIHVIQDQMGITGTTAREAAETISGSVAMTKAAFSNLLVGIADDEQDFEKLVDDLVSSATTAAGNILPRVETIIGGIGRMISSMSGIAADLIVDLTAYVPDLVEAGVSLIGAIIDGLAQNAPAVSDAILDAGMMLIDGLLKISGSLFSLGAQLLVTLVRGLLMRLPEITAAAKSIIAELLQMLTDNLPLIISAGIEIIVALADALADNIDLIISSVLTIIQVLCESLLNGENLHKLLEAGLKLMMSLCQAVVDNLPLLIDIAIQILTFLCTELLAPDNIMKLLNAGVEIITALADAIVDNLDELLIACEQIIQTLLDELLKPETQEKLLNLGFKLLKKIIEGLGKIGGQLLGFAADLFDELKTTLEKTDWGALGTAIVEGICSGLLDCDFVLSDYLDDFGENWLSGIKDIFGIHSPSKLMHDEVGEYLALGIGEGFSDQAAKVGTSITQTVSGWTANLSQGVTSAAAQITQGIAGIFDKLPADIKQPLAEAMQDISAWGSDMILAGKEAASDFLSSIGDFLRRLPDMTQDELFATLSNVVRWGADLVQRGKDAAQSLVSEIISAVGTLPDKMVSIGRNIVSGLWEGITGMGSWLRDQIIGFAGGILDGFKDAFGIASPSKVMRDSIGRYLAEGIGVGFTANIPQIGKDALAAFADMELPVLRLNTDFDLPSPTNRTGPRIDSDAVRMLQTVRDYSASGLVQPSPTSEITNNYYSSTTNSRTDSTQPVINVHVHCETEMDGEKVAEMVAEKVDILQGEAVTMDERGTAH